MKPRATGAELLSAVLTATPADCHHLVRAAFDRFAGQSLYLPKGAGQRDRRIAAARLQLAAGASRADTARIIEARFHCSRRCAWNAVAAALNRD